MIPSQAMMSAIPSPDTRGAFMAVSASLQQLAGGVASLVAGLIVVEGSDGVLQHFEILGYLMVATAIVSIISMYKIHLSLLTTN